MQTNYWDGSLTNSRLCKHDIETGGFINNRVGVTLLTDSLDCISFVLALEGHNIIQESIIFSPNCFAMNCIVIFNCVTIKSCQSYTGTVPSMSL